MTTHERELLDPVDQCLPDGRLNPAAVGWSRRPLHRCNLNGPWGRQKRWDHWAVTSADCALTITYADLDYLGLVAVALHDFRSGREITRGGVRPFARGFAQPDRVGGGDIAFRGWGMSLAIGEEAGGTRLRAAFAGVDADLFVRRPPGHETLNVVVPWNDRQFQFTSKQNTLPVEGRVVARASGGVGGGGRDNYQFSAANQSFACLDYGRGVWPARIAWNWASASGVQDGRTVGLQFGARWTDGSGMTENALCIDGRLHKIGEDVRIEYDRRDFMRPWTFVAARHAALGGRVQLTFEPFSQKTVRAPLLVAGAELHLCFGHFSGTVVADDGTRVPVRRLLGWAEEFRGRW